MIGIVIVSYKNIKMTVDFINNQLTKLTEEYRVIVIDNCSNIEQSNHIAVACGGICIEGPHNAVEKDSVTYVLPVKENLGFARGNNLGADFLIRNFNCEYLLFTNDDIEIIDKDVINKLISCFKISDNISVVGPRVLDINGKDQSPHYRIISPIRQLGWKLFPFLRKRSKKTTKIQNPVSSYCYWVSGCFFIMKTVDFISIKGFDPTTFLYSEEPILAERLKIIGKYQYFCSDTTIIHYGGCSTQSVKNDRLRKTLKESNCIYYRKYLHYNPIIIWLYRIFC